MTKPLLAALLTMALLAAAPSTADAGSYAVVGCADLAGALTPAHVVRPTDGWFLEAGVYPSRPDCAAGRSGLGLFTTGSLGADLFRFNAPEDTTISRLVMTYRAHLSGADAWAVPTFVVSAGHAGGWEYVGPARGSILPVPLDFGGDAVVTGTHAADALRIGTRCDLAGPCYKGGQPAARFHALVVVLDDDRAPQVSVAPDAARHVQGLLGISVRASDEGGGVFERSLTVEGRGLLGGALCSTVRPSVAAIRHVVRRVPCPLDAPAHVTVDTRSLADGPHVLRARAPRTSPATRGRRTRRSSSTTFRRARARSRSPALPRWGRA